MKLKERTADNVHTAFVGEAKAYQRLLMFAERADNEELPQIAHLFRAVAAAEGVHSRRHFAMLESVADTQANLEQAFQSETTVNRVYYLKMLREAEEDGEKAAVIVFSQVRDAEEGHAEQPLVREGVVGIEEFKDAAVFAHHVFEEELRLPSHGCPELLVETGEAVTVGSDGLQAS